MKKIQFSLIAIACFLETYSQNVVDPGLYPTADILYSTFRISTKDGTGSCFLLTYNGKRYLVTAKHLFNTTILKSRTTTTINIDLMNKWKAYTLPVFFHSNSNIDVAVFQFNDSVTHIPPYDLTINTGMTMGQQVMFLGFPMGIIFSSLGDRKIPFLKMAYFSGWYKFVDYDSYLLDGHNNVGFSGGPVLIKIGGQNKLAIVGVIVAYIKDPKEIGPKGKEFIYDENSGIIECVPVRYVKEIIDKMVLK